MNPKEKKVIKSRDIVFYASQTIKDIEKPTKSSNMSFSAKDIELTPTWIATDDNKCMKKYQSRSGGRKRGC